MPESGRMEKRIEQQNNATPVVAFNNLPIFLRGYNWNTRPTLNISLLPDQKSNRETSPDAVAAEIRYIKEDDDSYTLALMIDTKLHSTYVFAKDRLNIMLSYAAADASQTYQLKSVERVDYWSIKDE
jgi:hypothetical protein